MTPDEWQRFHEFEDYLRSRESYRSTPPPQVVQPVLEPTKHHRSFRLTSTGGKTSEVGVADSLGKFGWQLTKLVFLTPIFLVLLLIMVAWLRVLLGR